MGLPNLKTQHPKAYKLIISIRASRNAKKEWEDKDKEDTPILVDMLNHELKEMGEETKAGLKFRAGDFVVETKKIERKPKLDHELFKENIIRSMEAKGLPAEEMINKCMAESMVPQDPYTQLSIK